MSNYPYFIIDPDMPVKDVLLTILIIGIVIIIVIAVFGEEPKEKEQKGKDMLTCNVCFSPIDNNLICTGCGKSYRNDEQKGLTNKQIDDMLMKEKENFHTNPNDFEKCAVYILADECRRLKKELDTQHER